MRGYMRYGRASASLIVLLAAACGGGAQSKSVQLVAGDEFAAKVGQSDAGSLSAQFVPVDSNIKGLSLNLRGVSVTNQIATGRCSLHASLTTLYVGVRYQPSNLTLDCGHGVLSLPLTLVSADGSPGLPLEQPGDFVLVRASDQAVIDVSLYSGPQ